MVESIAKGRIRNGKPKKAAPAGLTYHEIATEAPDYLYSVSAEQFKIHMQCVKEFLSGSEDSGGVPLVTFDDGHVSQFDQAFPVLQDAGVKAIFFVTPSWTEDRLGYMSWQQLAELIRCGHLVQSHGWSHKLLTQCDSRTLKEELGRSRMVMEDRLGTRVDAISVPGGRWNEKVLAECAEAGYLRVFTSDPWIKASEAHGMEVAGRWMVTRNMVGADIGAKLREDTSKLYFLRAIHIAKAGARKLLGDRRYQTIWRTLSGKDRSLEALEDKMQSKEAAKH